MIKKYISNLSDTKKRIYSNILWAISGKVVNMLGVLFVGILIARYLGPEQYGLMNYVISYVSIFTIIASFGLENIEIRELAKFPGQANVILGSAFALRLLFSVVAFILVIASLFCYKADNETCLLIIIYSFSLFTSSFNVIRNYFISIVENEYIVKSEIVRVLIGSVIKIVLLLMKVPIEWFIVAMVFDTILVCGGYVLSYKKKVGKFSDWKYDKVITRLLIKESFPLLLSGAAVLIYQRIDQVMIGNMIDNVAVGYFATAGKFVDIAMFIPIIFVQTITPLLVSLREENPALYAIRKMQFISVTTWGSIAIAAVISVLALPIIKYTFGDEYLPAVPILQVMVWKVFGMALSACSGQIIIMEGIQKWSAIRNFISCGLCVGLNLVFIPVFGAIGAAWVSVITLIVASSFANIFIPPYHPLLREQLKCLVYGWKYCYDYARKR